MEDYPPVSLFFKTPLSNNSLMTYHSLLGEPTPSGKLLSLLNDITSKPSTGILYQRA